MIQLVDHIFIFILAIVAPTYIGISYRAAMRNLAAGQSFNRPQEYNKTMLMEWLALAALLFVWWWYARPLELLGFSASTGYGFFGGLLLIFAMTGALIYSLLRAKKLSAEEKAKQAEALGELRHFLPHTKLELQRFYWLSFTAGVVEEIIYRGFLLWYLGQWMPIWAAVLASSVIFGLGHVYQGAKGILRTGLAGLGFALLYLLTDSLWLPIIAHILVDALQGATILELLQKEKNLAES